MNKAWNKVKHAFPFSSWQAHGFDLESHGSARRTGGDCTEGDTCQAPTVFQCSNGIVDFKFELHKFQQVIIQVSGFKFKFHVRFIGFRFLMQVSSIFLGFKFTFCVSFQWFQIPKCKLNASFTGELWNVAFQCKNSNNHNKLKRRVPFFCTFQQKIKWFS